MLLHSSKKWAPLLVFGLAFFSVFAFSQSAEYGFLKEGVGEGLVRDTNKTAQYLFIILGFCGLFASAICALYAPWRRLLPGIGIFWLIYILSLTFAPDIQRYVETKFSSGSSTTTTQ